MISLFSFVDLLVIALHWIILVVALGFIILYTYAYNSGKFLKRWEYQTTWPASWEICMQVRKQELELDMEQRTGSK